MPPAGSASSNTRRAFDGVRDPQGYGRIEFAYHLMARAAGIAMMPCRLFEEGGRAHFMTRRFDRPDDGSKVHFASLFGIGHLSYAAPGSHSHSYEDYFGIIDDLNLDLEERIEGYRRMVFNVLGCNRDDHTKNFGFLFDEAEKRWRLAPAYDVTYAHNPGPGKWTATQQLSVGGKREAISQPDLIEAGYRNRIGTKPKLKAVLKQVVEALAAWSEFSEKAGVMPEQIGKIERAIDGACSIP